VVRDEGQQRRKKKMNARQALEKIRAIDRDHNRAYWNDVDRLLKEFEPVFEDDPEGFEINIGRAASFRVSLRKGGYRVLRWSHWAHVYDPTPMANEANATEVFDRILEAVTAPAAA